MRFRRSKVIATAAVSALALGVAAALASARFSDPVGDVRGGPGPDLSAIAVSHTRTTVTFRVRFAAAPPLAASASGRWVDMLLIGIDVPPRGLRRGAHGWTGLDYFVGLHGSDRKAVLVERSSDRVLARPRVVVTGRTLSFSVSRTALGDPRWVELVAAAGREAADRASGGGGDEAPDRGVFHYVLK